MRKKYLILLYVVIVVCIILIDVFAMNGVFTRDFTSQFVREGMHGHVVALLIGIPEADVGSGFAIMKYELPFDNTFYVTYDGYATVIGIHESETTYPFRGMLIPIALIIIAVLEVGVDFICRKLICKKT